MKKIAMAILLLLLFGLGGALAAEGPDDEGGYLAVVANPILSDRLNLREKPDLESNSLGRFYSGTPVYVLNRQPILDKEGRRWAHVDMMANFEAGVDLKGYMLLQYLMPMNSNFDAPQLFHRANAYGARLLEEPRAGAAVNDTVGSEDLFLLGDIGDDWRLAVSKETGIVGYVRAAALKQTWIDVPEAYLMPANGDGSVTVYSDQEMKRAKAHMYPGTPVNIVDYSKAKGWVTVQSYGVRPIFEHKWQADISGYVRAEEVQVFIQPWQAAQSLRTGIALEEIETENTDVYIPKGASVAVTGETGNQYQIVYGDGSNLFCLTQMVKKEQIDLTDRAATSLGPEAIGYAWIKEDVIPEEPLTISLPVQVYPGDAARTEDQTIDSRLAEIIGEVEKAGVAYWQLRNESHPNFYLEKSKCDALLLSDWRNDQAMPHSGSASFIAAPGDQGLWHFSLQPGQAGKVILTSEAGITQEYGMESPAKEQTEFSFLIEPGMKIEMKDAGTLLPLIRHLAPMLLPEHPKNFETNEVIFEGSGRYFCDWQYPDASNYFVLLAKPMADSGDSYIIESSLFSQREEYPTERKICFSPDEEENGGSLDGALYVPDEYFVFLQPGMFLEVHNCVLTVDFGNG